MDQSGTWPARRSARAQQRGDFLRPEFGSCSEGHGFNSAGQFSTTVIGLAAGLAGGREHQKLLAVR